MQWSEAQRQRAFRQECLRRARTARFPGRRRFYLWRARVHDRARKEALLVEFRTGRRPVWGVDR